MRLVLAVGRGERIDCFVYLYRIRAPAPTHGASRLKNVTQILIGISVTEPFPQTLHTAAFIYVRAVAFSQNSVLSRLKGFQVSPGIPNQSTHGR